MTGFRHFHVLVVAGLLSTPALLVATSGLPAATQQLDARTVRLPDGRLLRIGGLEGEGPQDGAALFDRSTGLWVPLTTPLAVPREGHTVTVTADGRVLIIGGRTQSGRAVDLIELFDPATEQMQWASFQLTEPRAYHSATVLTDGRLLIAGGIGTNGDPLASAELWDPAAGQLVQGAISLSTPRARHAARLDEDGHVRLSGGADLSGTLAPDRDDVFDPVTVAFNIRRRSLRRSFSPRRFSRPRCRLTERQTSRWMSASAYASPGPSP
jgi:hypothetical protein